MTNNNNDLANISNYLGQLVKMNAYNLVNNSNWEDKPNREKIDLLNKIGFSNEDIAELIGTTVGTVRKEISIRKNKS
ncbi:MAG: hypothetical protein K8R40_09380 [Anaerolineaceae bacterium]|nr:hypothetical protein [Anaerolineaceae bacterium]